MSKFKYLGIVFTSGGSFAETQSTLAGQAQKAIFKMNKYLYKFMHLSPRHRLELFDKLIKPILNYGSEVWGFLQGSAAERVFDTVLKVIGWPAFVSRCITDAYFSFYGLVLDIDMNCGCKLYRSFCQMDLTYAMDCLLNSITGMNVAFLLMISPPYTQLWLSQRD